MHQKILSQLEDYEAFLAKVEADAQAYIQGRKQRPAESQTCIELELAVHEKKYEDGKHYRG
jgi:hypothetical protein